MLSYWLLLLPLLAACSSERQSDHNAASAAETKRLRYQGSTGQVLYPELAQDLGYLAPLELDYVGNTISGPQDIQSVVTRDVDFGGAFNGAIVNLVTAKAPIKAVVAFSFIDPLNWGGFFLLDDSNVTSARDLIGKKVAMNTLGAHSEFTLREYLTRGGLTRAEIAQVTLVTIPPISTEQSLRQKQVDLAMLWGIVRDKALEHGGIHTLFRDIDLFGELTSASYVMHERFLREQPKAAAKFVEAVARAIEWTRATPAEGVRARMRSIIERRQRNEDASLIKYWKPSAAPLPGGVLSDQQMQVWIDWLVKDGQVRPDQVRPQSIYTNEFNPYAKVH